MKSKLPLEDLYILHFQNLGKYITKFSLLHLDLDVQNIFHFRILF